MYTKCIPDVAQLTAIRVATSDPVTLDDRMTTEAPNSWRLGRSANHQLGHGAGPGFKHFVLKFGEVKIMVKPLRS